MFYPFNNVPSFFYIVFGFILIKVWMDNRSKQAQERLRVIDDALKRGDLDEASRDEMVQALTGRRVKSRPVPQPQVPANPANPGAVGVLMKLVTFIGWMAFCVGMAFVIIVSSTHGYSDLELPATILSCAGFGMLTFPFVIRELQATPRRHASESGR